MSVTKSLHEVLVSNDWVVWWDPWPGMSQEGLEAQVDVELRVRAGDAVLMQRRVTPRGRLVPPVDLLGDFLVVHWARVLDGEGHEVEVTE